MMIVTYYLTKTPINLLCELGELICHHKVKEEREDNMIQGIYVIWQYAYVHWRR